MPDSPENKAQISYQKLATFKLPKNFRGRPGWYVQLWWIVQASLFHQSPQILYPWRRWLLKLFGMKIGRGVQVRSSVTVTYPWKVTVGDDCWFGDGAVLYSLGEIEIGDNCVVSQRSYLCAAMHDYTKTTFDMIDKKVTIGPECWVSADVFVGPGVTVGRGCVVGARSSVFSDLPEGMICVGSPAKPVRPRVMKS